MTKSLQEKQKNLLPDKLFADRAKNLVNDQFLAEKAKFWSHDKNFADKAKIKKPTWTGPYNSSVKLENSSEIKLDAGTKSRWLIKNTVKSLEIVKRL